MADMKRYGSYDRVIGPRRTYMAVYGSKLVTTTQFLDQKNEHGWVREENHTIDYRTEERAIDAMVEIAQGEGWRHSSEWPVEVSTAW